MELVNNRKGVQRHHLLRVDQKVNGLGLKVARISSAEQEEVAKVVPLLPLPPTPQPKSQPLGWVCRLSDRITCWSVLPYSWQQRWCQSDRELPLQPFPVEDIHAHPNQAHIYLPPCPFLSYVHSRLAHFS